jgi:hypothetical protein
MRRPLVALVAILVIAAGVIAAIILTRPDAQTDSSGTPTAADADLTLLVVRSNVGPFAAVVGSTGAQTGALAIPTKISVTVPGQGDARLDEALELPPETATTTVANVLVLPIDHYAFLGRQRLAALVDRAGGIEVAGQQRTGDEVVAAIEGAKRGKSLAFQLALQGLLDAGVEWTAADLDVTDDADAVARTLATATDVNVRTVEVVEPAPGVFRAMPEAVRGGVVGAFGGPDRDLVNVIVLNGSGAPGVGETVADKIVPGGFTVVVSENAQSFDHDETLVVVGSSSDVALGERVRDLLGVGSVNVSVSSGLAPVTIVVGKDLER